VNTSALFDIHCHGAVGSNFGIDEAGSRAASAHHRSVGVEALVASLVTAAPETLRDQVRLLAPLVADGTLAGIHLEGPFLSNARRGAHDPDLLANPDPGLVELLADAAAEAGAEGAIVQWTLAPELPGTIETLKALAERGILPALGHSDAGAQVFAEGLAQAAELTGRLPLVTHLYNGMPPLHHRHGGPAAVALGAAARGEAVVELIADGTHVAPEVVRMTFDAAGGDHVVLVSDAMAATGLGDGPYRLGSLEVTVTDGVARLANGAIAGSTATLADCLTWAVDVAGVDPESALAAASTTPARVLQRN